MDFALRPKGQGLAGTGEVALRGREDAPCAGLTPQRRAGGSAPPARRGALGAGGKRVDIWALSRSQRWNFRGRERLWEGFAEKF